MKTYCQQGDQPEDDAKIDAAIVRTLAAETSMIVLDTLELFIHFWSLNSHPMSAQDPYLMHDTWDSVMGVILHLMASDQSAEVTKCVLATQRAFVHKFPEFIFSEARYRCVDFYAHLVRLCSSRLPNIRSSACASLYHLMCQNSEFGNV